MAALAFLQPGTLGPLQLPNRVIRAGTGESMADVDGVVSEGYVDLHRALARGGVGLSFTGHMYVHPRGRYGPRQAGIHSDDVLGPLRRVTDAVHREGGRIFAQIAHAGSQSMVADNDPLAVSAVPNVMTGRHVAEASDEELQEAVAAFAAAARRAVEAGFDGVHVHGANGYLISQSRSPLTNRRTDSWGGTRERRESFAFAVVRAVRDAVPSDRGLTMKLGLRDMVDSPGGLSVEDAVEGAMGLVAAGLDGIEISSNLMSDYVSASIRAYVAVDRTRALEDWLVHRLHKGPEPEHYFLPLAQELRRRVDTTVILVGGLRRAQTMSGLVENGDADFLSLARPLIREPDLVRKLADGTADEAACVSCNICLMHDEHHPLQCWRIPRTRLWEHVRYRLSGGFKETGTGRKPRAH
ncbi:NADH:flavin oxidoreductase [Geodermatophilus sp. DF01-2]|uniref:oxidoreductase n=1 Tax=Geodermatophilus sp. DF01-2 TaxID=2559610 RepID=UPI0014311BF9|nr:NADH:flavin oxidoreductase [Geodermatophilus sp. DF01_2]